jgi:protein involved in plasmid replication-relaxation
MSGQQIRRTSFPDGNPITQARKTRSALKRLGERSLIVRLRRRVGGLHAGSEGQVVGLSGLGHAVLDLDTDSPRRHRSVTETKLAFQDHVLAVAELRVRLLEHARIGRCDLLDFNAEPACWRRFSGIGGHVVTLKPDAYVRLGVAAFELAAFIEQDMATESLPTIRRKLGVHIDYWRSGQELRDHEVHPHVWWLVPNTTRLTAIAGVIRSLPIDARALFAVARSNDAVHLLTQLPTEGGAR